MQWALLVSGAISAYNCVSNIKAISQGGHDIAAVA
jgi:hypothetical protein